MYTFQRSDNTWTKQSYIKASNTDAGDGFGGSVAIAGDILAVGAGGEASRSTGINVSQSDNTAGASGAVYLFRRSGASWIQEAYLKASNTGREDQFGVAMVSSDDSLVIGPHREASRAVGIGGTLARSTRFVDEQTLANSLGSTSRARS